jgi:cytoskeletal protein CcmA (bactofilin family)
MWTKQSELPPSSSSQQPSWQPSQSAPAASTGMRPSTPSSRAVSCVGASIRIEGKVTGDEDLQIDGKVDGSVVLNGQRLTVGGSGKLNSEIWARDVVVYGELIGNVHASDRVEIKKDGSLTGDITTARISVEDGAYFKGRIEIESTKHSKPETEVPELAGAAK